MIFFCTRVLQVLRRSDARQVLEIMDKVRLIKIAAVESNCSEVRCSFRMQAVNRKLETAKPAVCLGSESCGFTKFLRKPSAAVAGFAENR